VELKDASTTSLDPSFDRETLPLDDETLYDPNQESLARFYPTEYCSQTDMTHFEAARQMILHAYPNNTEAYRRFIDLLRITIAKDGTIDYLQQLWEEHGALSQDTVHQTP
jgi:hypothetical protein